MYDINYLELFIINTIIYFDLFDYPLTSFEIYKYLYTGGMQGANYSLLEIEDCLKNSENIKKIAAPTMRGFYFLKNRETIISSRLERYNISNAKFKIALKAARLFRYLPFVKMIAVCNSLGYNNAKAGSDIDLFIITEPKRLWLVRLFLIAAIYLLGLRPSADKGTDKICLSYYVTSNHLNLADTRILNDDIHMIFWLANFVNIYDRGHNFFQFYEANSWIKKYLPNWQMPQAGYRRRLDDNFFSRFSYKTGEFICRSNFGGWLERLAKKLQLKFMSQQKKDIAVRHKNWVILKDDILKFHINDRRQQYLEQFEQNLKQALKQI